MNFVNLISLGCPKNQVDSEYMAGIISKNNDYKIIDDPEQAQVIIINTCGFIEDAKEESIDTIIEAGKYKNNMKCEALIVTGCLTQRYQDTILDEMPEVDAILGTGNFDDIIEIMKKVLNGHRINHIGDPNFNYRHSLPRQLTTSHYSYVKIAEGCNNNCSYCVIPEIRGAVNSRTIEDVYQEVSQLGKNGVKEIILVAQDITQYGIDIYNQSALVPLLKKLVTIDSISWIRLLYGYPERITPELIDIIKKEPQICNYIDLPVQHSSNKIRNLMDRKGNRNEIVKVLKNLKNNIPDISLRTSLIVGFPGETKKDFNDLKRFVQEIQFDRLGVFQYSREEGTKAAELPNQVNEEIKEKRYNQLMQIQQDISLTNNKKLIGKKLMVIIDEVYQEYAVGRTQYDAPEIDNQVIIYDTGLNQGDIINCKIKEAYEYDLIGEKIS